MSEFTSSQPAPGIGAGLSANVERVARLFRAWVAVRLRRRPALVLALAGALSVLAMAPFHAWPILFLTLPVLFWSLEDAVDRPASSGRIKSALWRGWAFGFGFHVAGLFWIGSAFLVQPERFALIMPFAIAGLAAGLALFHGVATGATAMAFQVVASPVRRIAVLAAALMASEWLRGNILTGFPWNTLGQVHIFPDLRRVTLRGTERPFPRRERAGRTEGIRYD